MPKETQARVIAHEVVHGNDRGELGVIARLSRESPPTVNLWSVDKDYRYTFFNEGHREAMRSVWGADIAIGESLLDFISDEGYKAYVKENYDSILAGASRRSIDNFKTPDGEVKYFENIGNPVVDAQGATTGVMLFALDISERMRIEDELKRSLAFQKSITNSPTNVIILSVDRDFR